MMTEDTKTAENSRAVVGPVERQVRPRAWALAIHPRFGGGDYVCSTPTENGLPYEPLYDQAAIDAAVATERERCAKVCEAEADKWRGEQDISDFRLCASAIREGIE